MAQAMLLCSLLSHAELPNPSEKRVSSLLLSHSRARSQSSSCSVHPSHSHTALKTPAISKFCSSTSPSTYPTHSLTLRLHQTSVSCSNFRIPSSQQNTTPNLRNTEQQDSNSNDHLSETLKLPFPPNDLLFKLTPPTILLSLILLFTHPVPAFADPGAALFRRSCIGCHDAGGNVIQPGATLFARDLERNGVESEEEIYKITYQGKGRMPGFGLECAPRGQCTFGPRLSDDEIKVLAKFVKAQAEQGWVNISGIEE